MGQYAPASLVGQGDLDLAVEASWAKERGVQNVGAVRGHDHLDLCTEGGGGRRTGL